MISEEIYQSFNRKNVLVTGGTGMIGRQVCDLLVENTSAYVASVSLDRLNLNDKVHYRYGDLSDFKGFYELLKKDNIHFIFHCAGVKGSPDVTKKKPASFFVPLVRMNVNVLEGARLAGVKKLVYTSSIGAYGVESVDVFKDGKRNLYPYYCEELDSYEYEPMDSFPGWAKRMGELQIKAYKIQYDLDYSCVRLGNIYGIGDNFNVDNAMVIPSLISKSYNHITMNKGSIDVLGDSSAIRDFAYSRDIAKGIILALYYGTGNSFYNLGGGREISIKELVDTLRLFTTCNYNFTEKQSQYSKRVLDISLARERLGFKPETSLKGGLQKTWEWFQKNQTEYLKRKNYFK